VAHPPKRYGTVALFVGGLYVIPGNLFIICETEHLGRHFADEEKQQLFQDAKNIADLLVAVMDRKTTELKEGKQLSSSHTRSPQSPKQMKKGLEELGEAKRLQAALQWLAEGQRLRPGLKQVRSEDLPSGVTASRGYDHRGHCLLFEHT
jgi:hypothetical protein